jgi:hypothetical protein
MKTISMTFTAIHTFTVDTDDEAELQRACAQEAKEIEARTGLDIDPETIDLVDA